MATKRIGILTGGGDGKVAILDSSFTLIQMIPLSVNKIRCIIPSVDGSECLIGSSDGIISILSMQSFTIKKQSAWKKFQPVHHKTFGTGIIETVEEKAGEKTYLTVKFSVGTKKVDATFIEVV